MEQWHGEVVWSGTACCMQHCIRLMTACPLYPCGKPVVNLALLTEAPSSSQRALGFGFILAKARFPVGKKEDQPGAWQQRVELPITVAARAKLPRFQSSANEIENHSKVCQTICLLELKVQQAFQTCQTCRFRNLAQILCLPSLPFSDV